MVQYVFNCYYSWGKMDTKEEALQKMRENLRAAKDDFPIMVCLARVKGEVDIKMGGDVRSYDHMDGKVLDFGVNPSVKWNEIRELNSVMDGLEWLKKDGETIHGVEVGSFSTPTKEEIEKNKD